MDSHLERMAEYQDYIRKDLQPGKFRLVTLDDFKAPPEPCIFAEADDLDAAKRMADAHSSKSACVV